MTDHEFEQRLRHDYRDMVDEVAPTSLRVNVTAITDLDTTTSERRPGPGWKFPLEVHLGAVVLAATAIGGVLVLIGIGLLLRPAPDVGPPPMPDPPSAAASVEPSIAASGKPCATPADQPSTAASGEPSTAASGVQRPGGTWAATSEMTDARADHTATLLADGRVLVAGGRAPDDPLVTAEIFDPASGSWTPAADMLTGHAGHIAALLPDGRVLVVGDEGSELYDPDTDSWKETDPVTTPSTATLLADGRVLVTANLAPRARLFDPADDSWSLTAPMLTPRYHHEATLLPDGSVLVAGGEVVPDLGITSAERYDPATDCWTATGDSAVPARSHTATLLPDGQVLDVGWARGDQEFGELYDPDTGTWTSIDLTVPLPYSEPTAPLLPDGRVLFVSIDGSTALYDSASASWASGPTMTQGRFEPSVTLLANGEVLVAGGVNGHFESPQSMPGLSSAELYHPATGQ